MKHWTDEDIDQAALMTIAKSRIMARDQQIQPVLFLLVARPDGQREISIFGMRGNKDEIAADIQHLVRASGAEAALFVNESWAVSLDHPTNEQKAEVIRCQREGRLQYHPDVREIIALEIETDEGRKVMMQSVITGDMPNRVTAEPTTVDLTGTDSEGRFLNFFDEVRFERMIAKIGAED